MPATIYGDGTPNASLGALNSKDYGYIYPEEMDLRPGRPFHDDIVSKLFILIRDSYDAMKRRHPTWQSIDEVMTAYIPLSEYEKKLKKNDRTRPVSIVVPNSYAELETVLSYNTRAFLNGPVFRYEGVGPEDTVGAKLMELVIGQQVDKYKAQLGIHTGFRDGFCYGIGASAIVWHERWGKKATSQETPLFSSSGNLIGIKREKLNKRVKLFEGNQVIPIDPYKILPDPNYSIHRFQEGASFGWYECISLQDALTEEVNPTNGIFNMKYVKEIATTTKWASILPIDPSARNKDQVNNIGTQYNKHLVREHMYVKIIPRDWNLPGDPADNVDGLNPELWYFAINNDKILTACDRVDYNHGMFPVAVNAPDFDGYSVAPVSRMELTLGLQTVLDFLFNSHITNVRKALHDMFIVDPSLVSMKDLQSPEAGKYIRMRRQAWGRGVENAIKQFPVTDVTAGNIPSAGAVMDMMNRIGATSDAAQGVQRRTGPDRVTAAEFSGTFGQNISRLERLATITSLQYIHDMAYFYASHTQQYMSQETYIRAIGEWPKELQAEYANISRVQVDPFQILCDYDIQTKSQMDSMEEAKQLPFWQQIFPSIISNPLLFKTFNIAQIFRHIARLSGEKNVGDFIVQGGDINAQVVGDNAVREQAAAGNILPIAQAHALLNPPETGGE
jgi:hypothetical protein